MGVRTEMGKSSAANEAARVQPALNASVGCSLMIFLWMNPTLRERD